MIQNIQWEGLGLTIDVIDMKLIFNFKFAVAID